MNRWQDSVAAYMASSKVDQRFLGSFASAASHRAYDPSLSSMLYKLLGLSVIFSNKLNRAQTLRHLGGPILPHAGISDPSAEEEISETQHHVLWLAREGLMILEQYVLPSAELWDELRVLAQKMKASFYHAFVLFHNQPTVLSETEDQQVSDDGYGDNGPEHDNENDAFSTTKLNDILGELPDPEEVPVAKGLESVLPTSELFSTLDSDLNLNTASTIHLRPPGLYVDEPAKFATSFLLPAIDFTPRTTACFSQAASTADALLPGSHPLRISVKVEYAAYLFDCLHDAEASRIVAKKAILDTYSATEHMDDESFEVVFRRHLFGNVDRSFSYAMLDE
ncbi:hypothetical protein KEM55_009155 [Ascosphaera atra]|nr:hypothetical protein KEM55_009155 [Ascosphaera atra]